MQYWSFHLTRSKNTQRTKPNYRQNVKLLFGPTHTVQNEVPMYTFCRTNALLSFSFFHLAQHSMKLSPDPRQNVSFFLWTLKSFLDLLPHITSLSVSQFCPLWISPSAQCSFFPPNILLWLSFFIASSYLLYSVLFILIAALDCSGMFHFLRVSPHCLLYIKVLNIASNYLNICLRIWCFARWQKIKFSQRFYSHAKTVRAVQQQNNFEMSDFLLKKSDKNPTSSFLSNPHTHKPAFVFLQEFKSAGLEVQCTQSIVKCDTYCRRCGSCADLHRQGIWSARY